MTVVNVKTKKNYNIDQQGTDTIHAIITKKCQKYPSNTTLKHVNILDKVNKFPFVRLLNMTPHNTYSITTHLRTMTILYISHEQTE